MNYKLALSAAATIAAFAVTGCNSSDTARDSGSRNVDQTKGSVQSGTTSPGTANTDTTANGVNGMNNNNVGRNSTSTASKTAPAADTSSNTTTTSTTSSNANGKTANNIKHKHAARKHNPTSASHKATTTPAAPKSGASNSSDVYHQDHAVSSGTTTGAQDKNLCEEKVTYSQTPNPGGIAPQDRNLRFGLVGNGTGIGTEDTTSKFMTDNGTLADPMVRHGQYLSTGALSAPTQDEDELKDIKSGTSFDYYDISR